MRLRFMPLALVLVSVLGLLVTNISSPMSFLASSQSATPSPPINRTLLFRNTRKTPTKTPPTVLCPPDLTGKSLRIIAAGLGRSGSTWQFNALYVLMKMAGYEPASAHGQLTELYDYLHLTLACNVSIIKVHQFHPRLLRLADYVFTSHRDPRDAVVSLLDLGSGVHWGDYWQEYQRWATFACYDMPYEDMWNQPVEEIKRMAAVLGLTVDTLQAKKVLAQVEERYMASVNKSSTQWDAHTGYYTLHIRDPEPGRWRKNMSQHSDDLFRVENQTRDWMLSKGYKPWFPSDHKLRHKSVSRLHNTGNFEAVYATLTAPPLLPERHRCPLTKHAHEIGGVLPAGTWLPPHGIHYKQDDCSVYPLYCDNPLLFYALIFAAFFAAFFACFFACFTALNYYFPPQNNMPQLALLRPAPRASQQMS